MIDHFLRRHTYLDGEFRRSNDRAFPIDDPGHVTYVKSVRQPGKWAGRPRKRLPAKELRGAYCGPEAQALGSVINRRSSSADFACDLVGCDFPIHSTQ